MPAIHADFRPSPGVWGLPQTPENQKAQPFGSASMPAIHADFRLSEFLLRKNSKKWKQPAEAVP
jgi:hypothetical protein